MPYSDLTGQFGTSYALRDRTQRLIAQSEVTLDDYELLVKYLLVLHNAVDSVTSELRSFNEVVDINIYGGQAEAIHLVADKVRSNATALSGVAPPNDMEALNREMIVAITQAASGFDNLAYGLVIPADDPIYAAARQIENATADIDRIMSIDFDKRITESQTLKFVNDLGDKLELLSVR
jgi:extradiol dioxygenase family protein